MKLPTLKVFVSEGCQIPRFYEVAYRCWNDYPGVICYPIPLNWLVRWARMFRMAMRPNLGAHPVDEVGLDEYILRTEWKRGYKVGYDQGWADRDYKFQKHNSSKI